MPEQAKEPSKHIGIPTEELIDELMNRHDHCVFIGKQEGIKSPTSVFTRRKWQGDPDTCIGLSSQMTHMIIEYRFNMGFQAEEP